MRKLMKTNFELIVDKYQDTYICLFGILNEIIFLNKELFNKEGFNLLETSDFIQSKLKDFNIELFGTTYKTKKMINGISFVSTETNKDLTLPYSFDFDIYYKNAFYVDCKSICFNRTIDNETEVKYKLFRESYSLEINNPEHPEDRYRLDLSKKHTPIDLNSTKYKELDISSPLIYNLFNYLVKINSVEPLLAEKIIFGSGSLTKEERETVTIMHDITIHDNSIQLEKFIEKINFNINNFIKKETKLKYK